MIFSFGQIMIGRRSWEYYETMTSTIFGKILGISQEICFIILADVNIQSFPFIGNVMGIPIAMHGDIKKDWESTVVSLKMGWCTDAPPKADPHLHQQPIRLCLEGGPALGYVPVMYGKKSTGPLVFRANDVTALNVAWQFFLNGLNYSCSARGAIGLEDQDLGRSKDRTWTVKLIWHGS